MGDLDRATCFVLNVWFKTTTTIHSSVISHSSKSIWVVKLSFCQNDSQMGGSFWLKDSLITHILFKLWLITLLWIVSVFLNRTLFCRVNERLQNGPYDSFHLNHPFFPTNWPQNITLSELNRWPAFTHDTSWPQYSHHRLRRRH